MALPLSVVVHLVAAVLIVVPISLPEPEPEPSIHVELVPPPEPPEAKKEPTPAPEKPKPKAEPEKPKPETPEKAETPPPPKATEPAAKASTPVLKPVFQFGEKDGGPRKALDGSSAEDGAAEQAAKADPVAPKTVEEAIATPVEPAEQAAQPEQTPQQKRAEASGAEDGGGVLPPPPILGGVSTEDPLQKSPATTGAPQQPVLQPEIPRPPPPKPATAAKAKVGPKPQDAKKLFSQQATGDPVATTAMGGVPRKLRGGQLCVTELQAQLQRASPPYFADLLPSYPLNAGVVIEVSKAAFRVRGQWFNLRFRCEVDPDVTKVVDFAYRVGAPLDRSELEQRGLLSQ